jgi:5-hydroxyisourate hydrolase
MGISTHVLDQASGRPATGVPIRLERLDGSVWAEVASGVTDDDGRLRTLTPPGPAPLGTYRLTFVTRAYLGEAAFFPEVSIVFVVSDERHHHVPLLLAPFGYATYRGS